MSTPSDGAAAWAVRPIGVVHSPFAEQAGTPVQPSFAGHTALGTVFAPFVEGLDDLEGFERIWVLAWLDRAGPLRMKVVPAHGTRERGLFSTRSPHRPNPIGLSALRLLGRRGSSLQVADLDLLEGTPVLDIKPYAASIDVFPGTRDGWIADVDTGHRHTADGRFAPPG